MRVIQRYNRKICFTEFFDLYRLEIKLCLIIKTLGGCGGLPLFCLQAAPTDLSLVFAPTLQP